LGRFIDFDMCTTYVDKAVEVSDSQVVQDGGFVQIGHVGHIVAHLELGWIHLLNQVLLVGLDLSNDTT